MAIHSQVQKRHPINITILREGGKGQATVSHVPLVFMGFTAHCGAVT